MFRPDPSTDVLQLAALITQNTLRVVEEYNSAGIAMPGLESTDHNAILNTPTIREAIRTLKGACTQLLASVAPPGFVMSSRTMSGADAACIEVVVKARIADQLRDGPKSVAALAETARINAVNLGKVLRNLALKHCFTEVKTDVYANNRLSACLLSDRDSSAMIGVIAEDQNPAFAHLAEAFFKPEWAPKATTAQTTAFVLATGKSTFEQYEAEPILGERFGRAMLAWTKMNGGADEITRIYPWNTVAKDVTFCDVGGGLGHVSMALLAQHPHLQVVVQDQRSVLEKAEKLWRDTLPNALTERRARLHPINFFTEPPVGGCGFYYMKHILHDWPDADCIAILTNIRKAITDSTAKLLIHEFILHDTTRDTELGGAKRAPSPLLPNFGAGAELKHFMDINMIASFGGLERTLDDFIMLANASGFQFSKIWETEGELGLLELRPNEI